MPRSSGKPRPHRWIRDRNRRAQAALADAGGLVVGAGDPAAGLAVEEEVLLVEEVEVEVVEADN